MYNLCPTVLYDFYTQNGWTIEHFSGVQNGKAFDMSATFRFRVQPECSMYFVARRNSGNAMRFPTQSKYLNYPDLKAEAA
jgi:hypothetical protein